MDTNIVVAIITSGTVSALISFYLTSRQEDKKLRQERLEELFIRLSQWIKSFSIYSLNFRHAMQGKLSLNDVYDMMENISTKEEKDNLDKIEMIIGVYFPALQTNYDDLMSCRKTTNEVIIKFESTAKSGKVYINIFDSKLDAEMDKLDIVEPEFKKAIFREANALFKPWWKIWH